MTRLLATFAIVTLGAAGLAAQTSSARTVQASGSATIYANPDQAQLDVGVVTNAGTAQDSAQQNATMTSAVLTALKAEPEAKLSPAQALENLAWQQPTPTKADRRAEAKAKGYEGEMCGECGNFTLVRNGTCMKCDTCGSTTGCS